MEDEKKTKKQLIEELDELRICVTELKGFEEVIKQTSVTQEKFTKALLQSSIPMAITTVKEERFVDASDAFLKQMKFTRDEVIGRTLIECGFTEEQRATFSHELSKRGCIENLEMKIKTKDGMLIDGLFNSVMIRVNEEMCLLTVMTDISERKQTEETLRESLERYRSLFENSFMGISQALPDGRLIAVNSAFARMNGYASPEEMMAEVSHVGQKFYANSKEREKVLHILSEKGVMKPREREVIRCDGTRLTVLVGAREIKDSKGNLQYYQAEYLDITDRKRAEEELRESEEKFFAAFMNSPSSVTIRSANDGKYIEVNDIFLKNTGYERDEVIGRTPEELHLYIDDNDCVCLGDRIRKQGFVYAMEMNFRMKDGNVRNYLISSNVFRMKGEPYIISTIVDITERMEAEKVLSETLESLRKAIATTIQVMVSAVETRDPYTAGHQARVSDLARAIANEMGLPKEKIDGIRIAGSIHDIGKLFIPAEILSKPIRLSEIEFSLIKEHSRKGYEMLKDVESLWPLAEIVYQHHERINGSGYPRNLKGDDIIMDARILAIADVVEAMSSHRPYRPALGVDEAMVEIEKNRGVLYDVDAVNACLRLFKEKGYRFK